MDENGDQPRYFIDTAGDGGRRKSTTFLIAGRRCHECQKGGAVDIADSDPKKHIKLVAKHCSKGDDYLPSDTPLKEAIFRTILAAGNKPMSPDEISQELSTKWGMTAHARNVAPEVIQRLMDHGEFYSIKKVPEPKVVEKAPVGDVSTEEAGESAGAAEEPKKGQGVKDS